MNRIAVFEEELFFLSSETIIYGLCAASHTLPLKCEHIMLNERAIE